MTTSKKILLSASAFCLLFGMNAEKTNAKSFRNTMHWPVKGEITTTFQKKSEVFGRHSAIDIAVPEGTKVAAAAKGKVIYLNKPKSKEASYVLLRHGKKITTAYMYMSQVNVKKGDKVKKGDIIGLSGGQIGTKGAGTSSGPHLHFEVRKNNRNVNPVHFLKKRNK